MKATFFSCVLAFSFASAIAVSAIESGTEKNPQTAELTPGDFVWQPELSTDGPVVIIVDLSQQRLQVYRNGVQIGRSTISSGQVGYETPAGIFTIVEKNETHHSNKYHEASMPLMERLTWDGLAIHAGNVPNHPESHGCVHVPMAFAKKLYDVTSKGCVVLMTEGKNSSGPTKKPDLEFSIGKVSAPTLSPTTPFVWRPEVAATGGMCVVFSSADHEVHVYRDGEEIGRATTGASPSIGNRVYAAQAQTGPDGSRQWNQLGSLDSSPAPDAADVLRQLNLPAEFRDDMGKAITAGATLVLTDEAVDGQAAKHVDDDSPATASP